MAENLIKKGNSRLRFLFRQSKFLTTATRKLLSSALIQCHFDYACCWWYKSLTSRDKSRIQILQNKIIRFVLGLSPRSHIGYREFRQINWLPVEKRVDQIILSHLQRILHGKAPSYMEKNFILISQQHSHFTRHSVSNFILDFAKTARRSTFNYISKSLWNQIPNDLRDIRDIKIFKFKLKHFYFNQLEQWEMRDSVFY